MSTLFGVGEIEEIERRANRFSKCGAKRSILKIRFSDWLGAWQ